MASRRGGSCSRALSATGSSRRRARPTSSREFWPCWRGAGSFGWGGGGGTGGGGVGSGGGVRERRGAQPMHAMLPKLGSAEEFAALGRLLAECGYDNAGICRRLQIDSIVDFKA